jgi:hypothetical protein
MTLVALKKLFLVERSAFSPFMEDIILELTKNQFIAKKE